MPCFSQPLLCISRDRATSEENWPYQIDRSYISDQKQLVKGGRPLTLIQSDETTLMSDYMLVDEPFPTRFNVAIEIGDHVPRAGNGAETLDLQVSAELPYRH